MSAPGCRCGASWTGLKVEHCPECHETFTSTIAGDKHRTGKHHLSTGPDRRRCLSADEMRAKGMTQNKRGQWTSGGTSPWARCACGCPPEMHIGEIGCPCGMPDDPPCSPLGGAL